MSPEPARPRLDDPAPVTPAPPSEPRGEGGGPGEWVYQASVTSTSDGYRFDLYGQVDIIGSGWKTLSIGGWPSPTFDTEDVAGMLAVVADEHQSRPRRAALPHRIEWSVDGDPISGQPQVQPPPDWAIPPALGEGCLVEVGQRGVEGRTGTWPVYCRKPSNGWAMCPEHTAERKRAQEPPPGAG